MLYYKYIDIIYIYIYIYITKCIIKKKLDNIKLINI